MHIPQHVRRAAPMAATLAFLLLAGFSCAPPPPVTDGSEPSNPPAGQQPGNPPANSAAVFFVGEPIVTFNHVQPGVRSEFYVDLTAASNPPPFPADTRDANDPGPAVMLTLDGPGVMGEKTETQAYVPGQKLHFTWNIDRFGTYEAEGGIYSNGTLVVPISEELEVK